MTTSDLRPFLGGNDIGTVTYVFLGLCSVLSDFPLLFFFSGPFLGHLQAPCGGDVFLVCFVCTLLSRTPGRSLPGGGRL